MGNFKKMFMRPNLYSSGNVPAGGTLSVCPDIWINGDVPVLDYKKSLITGDSYRTESKIDLVAHKDNYIYVRGRNGDDKIQNTLVSLYWADGAVIQWPSKWLKNKLQTDLDEDQGVILDLSPDSIGIVERPFLWKDVKPYAGTCHYCLVAQFDSKEDPNPVPDIQSSIDMSRMVANNLRWGWRNVTNPIEKGSVIWSYNTRLTVPADIKDDSRTYLLFLRPENIPSGFQVSFECSQPDAEGKRISMQPTDITGDGQIMGCQCVLEPGFDAMVTVYLHNPRSLILPLENKLNFEADYYANVSELQKRNAMDLMNEHYTRAVFNHLRMNDNAKGAAILRLGGYSANFKK